MFPNYKKKLLGLIKKRDGWEDLGKMNWSSRIENGGAIETIKVCSVCNSILRIGKEDNKIFRYCPKCMFKINIK